MQSVDERHPCAKFHKANFKNKKLEKVSTRWFHWLINQWNQRVETFSCFFFRFCGLQKKFQSFSNYKIYIIYLKIFTFFLVVWFCVSDRFKYYEKKNYFFIERKFPSQFKSLTQEKIKVFPESTINSKTLRAVDKKQLPI